MDNLMEKLMISKKIMEKHDQMGRNSQIGDTPSGDNDYDEEGYKIEKPNVQSFDVPKSSYNIPQEYLPEVHIPQIPKTGPPTVDRIKNSKLPDEIKKLMMEHPIQQPEMSSPTLSDELVEKASRLMGTAKKQNPSTRPQQINESVDKTSLKEMMREVMEELLTENGLIVETTTKMNDVIQFKVGKTIFEGKITKVKKLK